jgi:hypothetical protein
MLSAAYGGRSSSSSSSSTDGAAGAGTTSTAAAAKIPYDYVFKVSSNTRNINSFCNINTYYYC